MDAVRKACSTGDVSRQSDRTRNASVNDTQNRGKNATCRLDPTSASKASPFVTGSTTTKPKVGDTREDMIARLNECIRKFNPEEQYHNPDPLYRLIGRRNEGEVEVNGHKVTALLDTGADISTISESLVRKLDCPVVEVESSLTLTGTGGANIPYQGIVQVELKVPHLPDYVEHAWMLILPTNPYHDRVPVTLGTKQLERVTNATPNATPCDKSWELVKKTTLLSMKAQVDVKPRDPTFHLEDIKGGVKLMQNVTLLPFESIRTKGKTSITAHSKRVNVVTSPSNFKREGLQVMNSYGLLRPGSGRVDVALFNNSEKPINIRKGVTIARVEAANAVPKPLVTREIDDMDPLLDKGPQENKVNEQNVTMPSDKSETGDTVSPDTPGPSGDANGFWQKDTTYDPTKPLPRHLLHGKPTPIPKRPLTQQQREDFLGKLDTGDLCNWSSPLQQEAKDLLCSYENIFSRGSTDMGRTTTIKHDIVLKDPHPFKERYRRVPPHLFQDVKAHLDDMMECGAITKSYSPWASAVVLAKKKDGSLRFCLDLRKLNNRTVKDAYNLPRIEETLDCLAGARIFTALDLKAGYWQVEMTERAQAYTAFTVGPLGFYECRRMPFGLTNAPATFQRLMESCLGDLHLQSVLIYLDDIIIYSTNPRDHLNSLREVFKRLEEHGLKLKASKCNFFQTKLEYLGHTVTCDGIQCSQRRIEDVLNWPIPYTIMGIRSFLGLASYYRRFIKNFAKIAKPLYDAIGTTSEGEKRGKINKHQGKKYEVEWTSDMNSAFELIKKLICTAPILAYPDFSKEFLVKIDASFTGLGAVLYQEQEGIMRVIAFASRGLRKPESGYDAYRLEFLGLKWAVTNKFKEYLYGAHFRVYTDSNPLTHVTSSGKTDATTQRWVAELAMYDFDLFYKPGKGNIEADALSRMERFWPPVDTVEKVPWPEEGVLETHHISSSGVQTVFNGAQIQTACVMSLGASPDAIPEEDLESCESDDELIKHWIELQKQDRILGYVHKKWEQGVFGRPSYKKKRKSRERDESHSEDPNAPPNKDDFPTDGSDATPPLTSKERQDYNTYSRARTKIRMRGGLLYKKRVKFGKTYWQLCIPKSMRDQFLKSAHDKMGHLGTEKTTHIVDERVYWVGMTTYIKKYVDRCKRCKRFKQEEDKAPLETIVATAPLELVHLDFLNVEIDSKTYKKVLVVTDHFTGYAQAYVTPNETAKVTARVFLDEFCTVFGLPDQIITDQGTNFESNLVKEMCALLGIKKLRTTPYHPQGNGQCERFNRTLISMLGTLDRESKAHWPKLVKSLVRCYNATRNRMTGFSPHQLMFGYSPRLPLDVDFNLPPPNGWMRGSVKSTYVKRLRQHLDWGYRAARDAREQEANKAKLRYDKKIKGSSLQPGDICLVKRNWFEGKHKIQDKWMEDDYKVVERRTNGVVYIVEPLNGGPSKTVHRNHLLPIKTRLGPEVTSHDVVEPVSSAVDDIPDSAPPSNLAEKTKPVPAPRRSARLRKKHEAVK